MDDKFQTERIYFVSIIMNQNKQTDDLIVGLCFKDDSVLYIKTDNAKHFPNFKLPHDTSDSDKIDKLTKYFLKNLNLKVMSVEMIGHIQKDPKDILRYFLDSHIFLYKIILSPGQEIKSHTNFEIGFHDFTIGQVDGFSYMGKLLLDFLKDWKLSDFKRIDSKDIWDWYNKWKSRHINSAFKEYIEAEIGECRGEADSFIKEMDGLLNQSESEKEYALDKSVDDIFEESRKLDEMMTRTAENIKTGVASPGASIKHDAELQLSALTKIKNHLCYKIYGLKSSHLNEAEKRIAYRLIGHLLKRTNDLIDKYSASGATLEIDNELKKLVYELESENLSPFVIRKN